MSKTNKHLSCATPSLRVASWRTLQQAVRPLDICLTEAGNTRGQFSIHQGEDMGVPSLIDVVLTNEPGAPVRVAGQARRIE